MTYDIIFDAIDLGVILRYRSRSVDLLAETFVEIVDQLANFKNAGLLERPAGHLLSEVAVRRLDSLARESGLLSEPLVLKHFSGTKDGQAG